MYLIKYAQSRRWSYHSETAVPITVKHDINRSTNGNMVQRGMT